jgi:hypothetical protein
MQHLICQEWDTIDILEEQTLWSWTIGDEQLRQRFRFGRETIDYLANELRGSLERPTAKRTTLSVEQQIMIALRFYTSGAAATGDWRHSRFRQINGFSGGWFSYRLQLNIIQEGFYTKAHFPNIIGCVNGTHVRIQALTEDEPSYVNRKGYHSINV